MNFLVVGLGSMGKRRIRCLQALGYKNIYGFDLREDRCTEARNIFGIEAFSNVDQAVRSANPGAFIISVPPDVHHIFMKMSLEMKKHFFVEASVTDTGVDFIKEGLKRSHIVAAPSATLLFHPAVRMISDIVKSESLGKISNIIFHCGQYLPDWHTYEKVSEYYVSNPVTGGAREIAPFELTWITHLFGFPKMVCGNFRKTVNIEGAEKIEDTYNFLLDYEDFLATVTIDVVSRYATRRLLINGDQKQLLWDWNLKEIQVYDPVTGKWEHLAYKMKSAAAGYNPNIGENMYIDEINAFIQAVQGRKPFINTMENDHRVLKLLYAIEASDKASRYLRFDG